ncbi:MAG: hypothetical protein EOO61_19765 [Hymenobacter sp.]|nr:MAG: hypothetical protein EOO61_19765 [Hymenobacter sp.]
MQLPTYRLEAGNSFFTYDFVSEGPKGLITKRVQFSLVHPSGVYNLAFGDFDCITQVLNDQAVSNNGDYELVLATVAAAAHEFCCHHPGASIFAVGGTPARTRLYQIGIARYLDLLQTQFTIYGELGAEWEPFQRNKSYTAFFAQPNDSFSSYL